MYEFSVIYKQFPDIHIWQYIYASYIYITTLNL